MAYPKGKPLSEEAKQKIRDKVNIETIRTAHLGAKRSESTKQKVREAALAREAAKRAAKTNA
jgi:hypothetical protein